LGIVLVFVGGDVMTKMSLVEKYRPQSLDEVIGQDEIIKSLKNMIARGEIPHLLFVGPPGTGKTTVAICLAKELFGDQWKGRFVELNASDERGIEAVRNKIKKLALSKGKRIIFLDECDSMTEEAQGALRRIMEKTKESIFILSCNYEHKIIDPIKSRCARFVFKKIPPKLMLKRLFEICKAEGIKVELDQKTKEAFMLLIEEADGDMRKAINMLEQLISAKKEITKENVILLRKTNAVSIAIDKALAGDFVTAKKMIEDAIILGNYDWEQLIRDIYKKLDSIQDEKIKIKLFTKLADLEYRCKVGSNPLIQFIGFIAYCWIVKHVDPRCPVLSH